MKRDRVPQEESATGVSGTGAPLVGAQKESGNGGGGQRSTGAPPGEWHCLVSLAQVPPLCHTTNVPQPRRAEPPDVAIRSSYRCSYTAEYASTSLGGLINQRSSVAGYIVGCPLVRMCSLACFGGGGERSALVSTEGGADRWEIRKRGLPPPSLPIHQNWPPLNHKLDKFPNGMRPNKSWKGFSVSLEHQHQTIRIS